MTVNKSKRCLRLKPVVTGFLLALSAQYAFSGLGALRILSSPGETFYAEIAVEPEYGLTSPSAVLAPLDRYSMFGPYSDKAGQLRFRTMEIEPGKYMISIAGPVLPREENLHFALELSWASGKVVREYHVPAGGLPPERPARKEPTPLAPPHEQKLMAGPPPPTLGEARLLSSRGVPFRVELELLGSWPQEEGLAQQFYLTDLSGVAGKQASRFELLKRKGRTWLRIAGQEIPADAKLSFKLNIDLGQSKLSRQFSFRVPDAGRRVHRQALVPPGETSTAGYQVKAGDSLSALARKYAPKSGEAEWMAEVVRKNAHAFAKDNPDILFASSWLVFPNTEQAKPLATPENKAVVSKMLAEPSSEASASKLVPPPAHNQASAPVMSSAEQALISKRLQEAQERMRWLEDEIARLSAASTMKAQSIPAPLAKEEEHFLDENLHDWLLWGGGGISVASLLAWMLWRSRQRKAVKPVKLFTALAQPVTASMSLPDGQRPLVQPTVDAINIDAIDVFAEADVLMAYGRFDAAETLLRDTLRAEPEREDVRIKLLDLIARKGNKGEFEEVALDVLAVFGPDSGLWSRVQSLGQTVDEANPLYRNVERQARATFVLDEMAAAPVAEPERIDPDEGRDLLAELAWPEEENVTAMDMAANDRREISMAKTLPPSAEIAELVKLYREMGDNESADALLREAGILPEARESI